jgi:hypothetical protein
MGHVLVELDTPDAHLNFARAVWGEVRCSGIVVFLL